MAIIKNRLKKHFTITPNEVHVDRELCHGSHRVFCYVASRPDDWQINNSDICGALGILDPDTLTGYWKTLISAGWISREKQRNNRGHLTGFYDYILHETKQETTETRKNPVSGKTPNRTKPRTGKTPGHNKKEVITKTDLVVEFNEDFIELVKNDEDLNVGLLKKFSYLKLDRAKLADIFDEFVNQKRTLGQLIHASPSDLKQNFFYWVTHDRVKFFKKSEKATKKRKAGSGSSATSQRSDSYESYNY
jgi:hypothetical protein